MHLQKLPIVPRVVQLRLPTPTFSVWNSLPIFDWTGLEPVTHLLLQSVFPLTPSANIISVFIHLTIIYMVTDMKIMIYFIKDWFLVVGVVGLEPTLEWFWVIYLLPIGLHAHILRGIDIISPSQQKGELADVITLSFPNWLHSYYITLEHICQEDLRKNLIYCAPYSKTGRYGNIIREHMQIVTGGLTPTIIL